jgi:hypothetical protein
MKNQKTVGIIIGAVAAIVVCVGMVIFLVPGDNKGESKADNPEAAYNTKGKCKFYECLNALTNESTPEEVEKVIGFKPKSEIDEEKKTEKHTWVFDNKHTIVLNGSSYGGKRHTISIRIYDYDYDDIEQKGVKFDKVSEIKANINKGDGVSYEEFKEKMGGVDGVLIELGTTKKYEWRSTDSEGYMTGTFNSDGKCTFMSGMTY